MLILLPARHAFLTLPWVSSAGFAPAPSPRIQARKGAGNYRVTPGGVTAPWNRSNKTWPGGRERDDVLVREGRLNIISHLLSQVPYTPPAPRDVTLPRRQPAQAYVQPGLPRHYIPAPF